MNPRVVIVVAPAGTSWPEPVPAAAQVLARRGLTAAGGVDHFATRGPLARRRRAASGRIARLDLAAMRRAGASDADARWRLWTQVVSGTPNARPWRSLLDRHQANPAALSLEEARDAYTSQPRYQAMALFNATVGPQWRLPTEHLEILQTGHIPYTRFGALAAVPTDALLPAWNDDAHPTAWWTPTSGRLEHLLAYLSKANHYLDHIQPTRQIAALALRQPDD